MNTWNDNFKKIANIYVREFSESQSADDYVRLLSKSEIRLSIFCIVYGILVREGKIAPLKNISEKEMEDLRAEVTRLSHSTERDHKNRLAKTIYTLGQYIQL